MMFSHSIPTTSPTSGLELRFYKGQHSAMLREIADFIDEHVEGRLIVGIWAGFDEQEDVHTMEVVVTHDEDAYMDYLSVAEAAARLSMTPNHLERLCKEGRIPSYLIEGVVHVGSDDVETILNARGHLKDEPELQLVGYLNPSSGALHRAKMDLHPGRDWEPLYIQLPHQERED